MGIDIAVCAFSSEDCAQVLPSNGFVAQFSFCMAGHGTGAGPGVRLRCTVMLEALFWPSSPAPRHGNASQRSSRLADEVNGNYSLHK